MLDFINDKFSSRAKNSLRTAQDISRELEHPFIGSEHLLYGIINEISSFASEILLKNKITTAMLREELKTLSAKPSAAAGGWQPRVSKNLRAVLETAASIAAKYQYHFIGTEHLL